MPYVQNVQQAEELFLGGGPVPYFHELYLLFQELGVIGLQRLPRVFDRVRKLGEFFINDVAGPDDDEGEQPKAQIPEKGVSPGFPFGVFLPGRFFFRGVFGHNVQGGFQAFFSRRGGGSVLVFFAVLPGGEAGFVFGRREGLVGRLLGGR